ncbi:polysaccharide pyruvyl transferase family protein [Sediminicoccus sp. BL-A-41-H5]|uniref:polysaccharide pyruvyl transferase family protein n=1 Tax=Sediminicoccus sp. BL-A-41-H5 TaxID=3421106 RepID=UPI003D666564
MIAKYRYWQKIRNCGDAITSFILRDVVGVTPKVSTSDEVHLLATGSIFFMATERSFIWGSGILDPNVELRPIPSPHIRAVRGKLSWGALKQRLPDLPVLPLGDPGSLVGYLLQDHEFSTLPITHKIGLIPHHKSFDKISNFYRNSDAHFIDMRDAGLGPIRAIQQSEIIVSQSLHGLIFASALGKPHVWLSEKDDPRWNFKFNDWFSTTDNGQTSPILVGKSLQDISAAADLRPSLVNQEALLGAFPYDDVCTKENGALLDFETCRTQPVAVLRTNWIDDLTHLATADGLEKERTRFCKLLRNNLRDFFASWSETPYVLIVPPTARGPIPDLESLASIMDRYASIDSMLVSLNSSAAFAGRAPKMVDCNLRIDEAEYSSEACLLLRPTVPFNFKSRICSLSRA